MGSVTVKRLKYGESSTIKMGNHQIIIDCGSENQGDSLSSGEFAYNAIKADIENDCKTDLLVTHFHKDHFNGILHIPDSPKRIENIYLPYSIIKGDHVFAGAISRLLVVASRRSWGFQLSSSIIELFLKVERLVGSPYDIRFVKAGDTIEINNKEIRVLWPDCRFDIGNLEVYGIYIKDLTSDKTVSKNNNYLIGLDDQSVPTLKSINERIDNQYSEILGYIRSRNYDVSEIESSREKIYSALKDYLDSCLEREDTQWHSEAANGLRTAEEIAKRTNESFWRYIGQDKLLAEQVKTFSRNQYHGLITTMNAISIVCDSEQKFIFMGDLPAAIVEHLHKSFKPRYTVVKIQHHGTQPYYTSVTPTGQYYIISNGGYERRKVGEQFVSNLNGGEILCTNAHEIAGKYCSYWLKNKQCKNTCKQLSKEETILI